LEIGLWSCIFRADEPQGYLIFAIQDSVKRLIVVEDIIGESNMNKPM